jgi:MFS family permease
MKFNLVCNNSYKVKLIEFIILVSSAISSLLIFIVADIFGRKNSMLLVGLCGIFGNIISLVFNNFILISIGMIISSLGILSFMLIKGAGIFLAVVSIYLNETVGGKYRELSNSIVFIFYGCGGLFLNIHSIWWSSYYVYFIFQLIVSILCFTGMIFLPKSPFFLNMKKRYDELEKVFIKIAKINGVTDWSKNIKPKLVSEIQIIKRQSIKQNQNDEPLL